jgi:hypothetical protein
MIEERTMPRLSTRRKVLRAGQTPQTVAELLQHHAAEIARLFDSPKLTIVIRSTTLDMPLVVTNDQPEETIAAIRKMVTVMPAPALN